MTDRPELAPVSQRIAFGETLGLDVPTRYDAQTHAAIAAALALDSLVVPSLLRMSTRTVWACQLIAGMLLALPNFKGDLSMRHRLELEAGTGLMLMVLALQGVITRRPFEQLYLFIGGGMIVANSLMAQVE
jgi:hypothetical protein